MLLHAGRRPRWIDRRANQRPRPGTQRGRDTYARLRMGRWVVVLGISPRSARGDRAVRPDRPGRMAGVSAPIPGAAGHAAQTALHGRQHGPERPATLAPMREITDRALDTAGVRGAAYADVRLVRRREESIDVKTGRLAGVVSHETEGFGVRVLVDGAWGFASSHRLTAAEADRVAAEAVRIARASATALRHRVALDDRPPARGRFETPLTEDPFAHPARGEDRRPPGGRPGDEPQPRGRVHRLDVRRPAGVEDLRRQRRQLHRAGDHPLRGGDRGERRRRRRAPAAELPRRRGRLAGRRVRVRPLDRPRGNRRSASPPRPWSCSPHPSSRRAGGRSSSTPRSCTCRSTRAAATRSSSTASSAPRPASPGRAS